MYTVLLLYAYELEANVISVSFMMSTTNKLSNKLLNKVFNSINLYSLLGHSYVCLEYSEKYVDYVGTFININ